MKEMKISDCLSIQVMLREIGLFYIAKTNVLNCHYSLRVRDRDGNFFVQFLFNKNAVLEDIKSFTNQDLYKELDKDSVC